MVTNAAHFAKPEFAKLLQRITRQLREALPSGTFEEREQAALKLSNEVTCRAFREELQEIADSFGESVEHQGKVYKRHQSESVSYPSLCGPVEVTRYTYRLVGVRNGPLRLPWWTDKVRRCSRDVTPLKPVTRSET